MAFIDFLIVLIEMNLSVLCGEWGQGGLEAGKIGGGRVRKVGAGKSRKERQVGILKRGKWEN